MDRENFYTLLDLEPGASLDEILKAIDLKLSEWNRDDLPDQQRYRNQEYRKLEPLIRQVMTNQSQRDQEAADWYQRSLNRQDSARTGSNFQIHLALEAFRQYPGYISEDKLEVLGDRYGISFKDSEFVGLIQDVGITVKPITEVSGNDTESGGFTVPDRLGEFLSDLGEADLYHFLGVPANTETEKLRNKSSTIAAHYRDIVDRFGDNATRKRVAGYCMTIFKNQARRMVYDEYLEKKGRDRIKAPIIELAENIASLNAGILDQQYTDHLIGMALEGGLKREDMESELVELGTRKGISVIIAKGARMKPDYANEIVCVNRHINPKFTASGRRKLICDQCRVPLTNFIMCRSCDRQNPGTNEFCDRCTAPL